MSFKSWQESVAKEIDRMIEYGDAHPTQASIGSLALFGTALAVLYGTPLHEYTIDPLMDGVNKVAERAAYTKQSPTTYKATPTQVRFLPRPTLPTTTYIASARADLSA
jgi:hypothetical protein